MLGGFIYSLCVACMSVFGFLLFASNDIFSFWMFYELLGLCLVPLFFLGRNTGGLLTYLVVSGVASSLFLAGVMFEGFLWLAFLAMLIKFGVFPFFGWVYSVIEGSSWPVIWSISSFLKVSFFIFPFCLLGCGVAGVLDVCSVFSFLFLSLFFWVRTTGWRSCWCHMLLSSSVSLVVISCHQDLWFVSFFFFIYVFWATLCVFFLSYQPTSSLLGSYFRALFIFLFLSIPPSFSFFYKLVLCSFVLPCGFFVFVAWSVCTISEQVYLWAIYFGGCVPRSATGFFQFV